MVMLERKKEQLTEAAVKHLSPFKWFRERRSADIPKERIEGRPPPGFRLLPGFVQATEHDDIAAWIDNKVSWSCGSTQGNLLETWTKKQKPLPAWSSAIGERMVSAGIFGELPDYVHLIDYKAGGGIAMHMDHEFLGAVIAGLTLRSSRVFELTRRRRRPVRILLMPGDLYVMTGEARYRWEHRVPKTRVDRFRGQDYERTDGFSVTWRRADSDFPLRGIDSPDAM